MRREHLAHLLRAAGRIAAERDLLVIGSQSVLGTWDEDELPEAAILSMEADLTPLHRSDPDAADLITGALGELSEFDRTFGYHADGVSLTTAVLPAGWRERLVVFDPPDAEPGRGLCLEPHDCVVAKLHAGRPKDYLFASALIDAGLVDPGILFGRIGEFDEEVSVADRKRMHDWLPARTP